MTLKEVGIVIGKKLEKSRCSTKDVPRYRVSFEGTEIRDKSMLIGACGRGPTVGQAKVQYCKKLGGEIVVVDAMLKTRKEFQLPPKITVR